MNRQDVRSQILGCTGCSLSARCSAPVPFSGPSPAALVVVGEAPGKQEDTASEPFVGPAGQLLRSMMRQAGHDLSTTMFCNAASCYPIDHEGKGRAPSPLELDACRPNLDTQLELSEAKHVLLVGAVAMGVFKKGVKISEVRGRPFWLDATKHSLGERLAFPIYHPSYVLRRGGEGSKEADLTIDDLRKLKTIMEWSDWRTAWPELCVKCDSTAEYWEQDGFGRCEEHK